MTYNFLHFICIAIKNGNVISDKIIIQEDNDEYGKRKAFIEFEKKYGIVPDKIFGPYFDLNDYKKVKMKEKRKKK